MPHVLISAHSGGAEQGRPGSLAAYQAAAASGVDYAELDVHQDGDGKLVAQHSAPLNGDQPLTAAEVMRVLAAGGVRGHVDLKGAGFERDCVSLALEVFGEDGFVVTTPDPGSVAVIRAEFPSVPVGLSVGFGLVSVARRVHRLRGPRSFPHPAVRASGANWVAMSYRYAGPRVLDRCVAAGLRIMVWTVNDDRRLDRFLGDPRVGILVTDRPGYALSRRAART
jgi:glycerophosphoryl diester phosphodiesterase